MAVLTANFNLGANGVEIETTDSGDLTAWDSIVRNASIAYDNTHALGALSAHFLTNGAAGSAHLRWTTAFGTQTEYYGRVCIYRTALPSGDTDRTAVKHIRSGGTGESWSLHITSAGKIRVFDQAGTSLGLSTATTPLNSWYRIEWHVNNTTGFIEVLYYSDATSASLTETVVSGTPGGLGADTTGVDFGTQALNDEGWMDGLVANAASYPGPVSGPTQQLLASADSVDGSWTNESGGTTLAGSIDETTASDSDYIQSELAPSASGCRVKLAAGGDPASSSGHEINWRAGKNTTGGQTVNLTVKLYQGGGNSLGGGTLIADFDRNGVDAMTDYTETLSGGEADAITDYSDLYLEFHATAT